MHLSYETCLPLFRERLQTAVDCAFPESNRLNKLRRLINSKIKNTVRTNAHKTVIIAAIVLFAIFNLSNIVWLLFSLFMFATHVCFWISNVLTTLAFGTGLGTNIFICMYQPSHYGEHDFISANYTQDRPTNVNKHELEFFDAIVAKGIAGYSHKVLYDQQKQKYYVATKIFKDVVDIQTKLQNKCHWDINLKYLFKSHEIMDNVIGINSRDMGEAYALEWLFNTLALVFNFLQGFFLLFLPFAFMSETLCSRELFKKYNNFVESINSDKHDSFDEEGTDKNVDDDKLAVLDYDEYCRLANKVLFFMMFVLSLYYNTFNFLAPEILTPSALGNSYFFYKLVSSVYGGCDSDEDYTYGCYNLGFTLFVALVGLYVITPIVVVMSINQNVFLYCCLYIAPLKKAEAHTLKIESFHNPSSL